MYTLYGMAGACSMAVDVLLNELNQPTTYVEVRTPAGQPKSPELLKVNPRGKVPVLVDGETIMREGGAIIFYLLDKHASPMLPKTGPERAKALEWLMFANATMHPSYAQLFFLNGMTVEAAAKDQLIAAAIAKINDNWKEVDTQLGKTAYVCGESLSAADILLTVIANWAQENFGSKIALGENTRRMIKQVIARPAYRKALKDEKVEYKAAA